MANGRAPSGGAAAGLKVGIIGGSIAGCTAAVELMRAGCEVSVLERSTGNLEDRGAGIGLAQSLIETLRQRDLIDTDMPYDPYTTLSRVARSADGQEAHDWGREIMAMPAAGITTSWGVLYQQLRSRVPADVYTSGCEVTDLWEPQAGGAGVQLADGRKVAFDLVVCADGYTSLGRQRLFPDSHLQYAGYVGWRGLIDERLVPSPERFAGKVTQAVHAGGHCVLLLVPGRQGAREVGQRQMNWVWYALVPEAELPRLLTDRQGLLHATSLPPGAVPVAQTVTLHRRARQLLPDYCAAVIEATAEPFLQVIYDLHVPSYQRGRMRLLRRCLFRGPAPHGRRGGQRHDAGHRSRRCSHHPRVA